MQSPRIAFVLVTAWACGVPLAAQEIGGRLEGRVVSAGSVPLEGARVVVRGPALQGTRDAVSDGRGSFRIDRLPVGRYEVRFGRLGYRSVLIREVGVELGRTTTLGELRMEVEIVPLPDIVVVADPGIDPTSAAIESRLDAATFELLPTDRDFQSLAALLPHANPSFHGDPINVAGSSGLENLYFVDGVNTTSPLDASTATALPYNFIRAIEVKQAGHEAAHGRALGGIINVVTHAGSDRLELGTHGFLTHSALAATPVDVAGSFLSVERFASYDVGASARGPIVRDRLWFATAYNPAFTDRDVRIPGHGVFADRRRVHSFAGKLTWSPGPATDVTLSVFGDPTTHEAVTDATPTSVVNPDPLLERFETGGIAGALSATRRLGASAALHARLVRFAGHDGFAGSTERGRTEPRFNDLVTGELSGGAGDARTLDFTRTAASLAATVRLGPHTLEAGAELEHNRLEIDLGSSGGFILRRVAPSVFLTRSATVLGRVRSRNPSFFLQDSWAVSPRVSLTAGLRWDGQDLPDAISRSFPNQWQPRVGITFQPGEPGRQKVFAAYGRYYQQLPLHIAVIWSGEFRQTAWQGDPRMPGAVAIDSFVFETEPAREGAAEHVDELVVGYEVALPAGLTLAARGVQRVLGTAFTHGVPDPAGEPLRFVLGNPGRGELAALPEAERTYRALELTLTRTVRPLSLLASYVLSRTHGNYTGLYQSDRGRAAPNQSFGLQIPEQAGDNLGLLPNDRTHVLKLSGAYTTGFGLTAGAFFTWQSGTPRSEIMPWSRFPDVTIFVAPRGSAGRTPGLWDLGFRLTQRLGGRPTARFVLDLLHVGSPRRPTRFDQVRYVGARPDGSLIDSPTFGDVAGAQPPFLARLGFEIGG